MSLKNINHEQAAAQLTDKQISQIVFLAPVIRMICAAEDKPAAVFAFCDKKLLHGETLPKSRFLKIKSGDAVRATLSGHIRSYNRFPNIITVDDLCAFAAAPCMEGAGLALSLALSGASADEEWVGVDASAPTNTGARLKGKVIFITGAAQGFGLEIALSLAEHGAYIVASDINYEGAKAAAAKICQRHGQFSATALRMDVTCENEVREAINKAVCMYGGLDVFVSNAGILRSSALDEFTLEDFSAVTEVNYTGYFLCTKYASAVMKLQNSICPDYRTDIIQINSKSGLTGSNKNCAYAGSKFGSIGLTQSFAMELAEFGIKVNAICPGNYLAGPLWMDPESGLFTQYLRSNKVKGASTVEDLIAFYNTKVPLNRSCEASDVVKAVLYLIEQSYETGQALPVTGGQIMLH